MRILIVDDDKDFCEDLEALLKDFHHETQCVYDGKEALRMIVNQDYDLVISDVIIPGYNGFELAEKCRALNRDVNIILISGKESVIQSINAMETGVADFFEKPLDVEKMLNAIRNMSSNPAPRSGQLPGTSVVPLDEYVFPAPIPELHDNVGKIGIFSEKMERIYSKLRKLQEYPRIPVLISGETGTGKEVIAKYLHYENSGIEGQFIAVNCATLNDDLFSSELFGYEEGSFTGARRYGKAGKIELARGGTLFLDEITEISIENQAKLLRVIEEREYYKVGGSREFKTDTRFVFASNRDLKSAVQKGFFRKDLYHRLSVCQVTIPPLRERKQEIGPLTVFLLQQLKHHLKKEVESIEKNALKLLKEYSWPGNIRELKNILTHILIFEETTVIREKHINSYLPFGKDNREKIRLDDFELPDEPFDLEEFTRTIVRKTLGKFRGNKTKTAKFLGLSRGQLYRRYRLDEE